MGNLTLIAGWWLCGWLSETKVRKWGYEKFLLLFKAPSLFSEDRLLNERGKRWMNVGNKSAGGWEEITLRWIIRKWNLDNVSRKWFPRWVVTAIGIEWKHTRTLRALFMFGNDKNSLKLSALCWTDHYNVLYDLLYSKVTLKRWL